MIVACGNIADVVSNEQVNASVDGLENGVVVQVVKYKRCPCFSFLCIGCCSCFCDVFVCLTYSCVHFSFIIFAVLIIAFVLIKALCCSYCLHFTSFQQILLIWQLFLICFLFWIFYCGYFSICHANHASHLSFTLFGFFIFFG